MTRVLLGFCALFFVVAVVVTVLTPVPAVPEEDPVLLPPEEVPFWFQYQTKPQPTIDSNYWLDDPSEAWHEADEQDDSDDPEIYNDKYDGR